MHVHTRTTTTTTTMSGSAEEVRVPPVTWAQRKDRVLVQIGVPNCESPTVRLDAASSNGRLFFQADTVVGGSGNGNDDGEKRRYELVMDLCGEIDADASKVGVSARYVTVVIAKKEVGPHWPRLLKQTGKAPNWLKIDWDKWLDEDRNTEM